MPLYVINDEGYFRATIYTPSAEDYERADVVWSSADIPEITDQWQYVAGEGWSGPPRDNSRVAMIRNPDEPV